MTNEATRILNNRIAASTGVAQFYHRLEHNRSTDRPSINEDWKANAQANAAALNLVYEYVASTYGPIASIEHMPDCAADPAILAQHIIGALEAHFQKHITD